MGLILPQAVQAQVARPGPVQLPPEKMFVVRALTAETTEVAPMAEFTRRVRQRHGQRPPYLELLLPDAVVDNLKGPVEDRDVLVLVHIRRDVFDKLTAPATAIVAPDGTPL